MKRGIAIILTGVLCFAVCACQSTSEQDILIKKDHDRLVEKARSGDGKRLSELAHDTDIYSYHYQSPDDTLQIHVEAPVTIPSGSESMAVFKTTATAFSQSDVYNLFQFLYPNEKPLDLTNRVVTKAEVEELLIKQKQAYEDGSYTRYGYSAEGWQKQIAETEEWYRNAPAEKPAQTLADGTMHRAMALDGVYDHLSCDMDNFDVPRCLYVRSYLQPVTGDTLHTPHSTISYYKYSQSPYHEEKELQFQDIPDPDGLPDKLLITVADADALCQRIIRLVGGGRTYQVSNVSYLANSQGEYAVKLRYSQTMGGLPTILVPHDSGYGTLNPSDLLWGYEYVKFIVDGDGLVRMIWDFPVAPGEILVDDAKLLSFDQIRNTFENMVVSVYEEKVDDDGAALYPSKIDVSVHEICLQLIRIREQGTNNRTGMFVPAWIFYGHTERTTKTNFATVTSYDEVGGVSWDFAGPPIVVMAISAIDGSVIDIGRGW